MKKKFFVAAGATVLALSMSMSAMAADVPTDYEAYFTFDENLENEKGGSATAVEKGDGATVGSAATKTFDFVDGQQGKAVAINNGEEADNIGIDTGVTLNGTDSFTISFWAKAYNAPFAGPVVWTGATSQSPEAWIGFFAGFNDGTWGETTGIGSNDAAGARVAATKALSGTADFEYTYITMTVDADTHKGVLYYDGEQVAETEAELPTLGDGSHIYIGANAWDAPANMEIDEFVVYKRVLTAEEVKVLYDVNGVPKADAEQVEHEEKEPVTNPEGNNGTDDNGTGNNGTSNNGTDSSNGSVKTADAAPIAVFAAVAVVACAAVVVSRKKVTE